MVIYMKNCATIALLILLTFDYTFHVQAGGLSGSHVNQREREMKNNIKKQTKEKMIITTNEEKRVQKDRRFQNNTTVQFH